MGGISLWYLLTTAMRPRSRPLRPSSSLSVTTPSRVLRASASGFFSPCAPPRGDVYAGNSRTRGLYG